MAHTLLSFLAIFSCFLLSVSSLTVDLFHRDSPRSPFYDRSLSKWERANNAVMRAIHPKLGPANGDQLMQISVGTPPKPFNVVVNTKNNLIWIQCEPCIRCYKQTDPLFTPSQSSTYKVITCSTPICEDTSLGAHFCDASRDVCMYEASYNNGSQTRGEVSTDTITIGSKSTPGKIFGCGRTNDNSGYFQSAAGVIGLGPKSNILNQVNGPFNGDLSYCIAPVGTSGKLSFGNKVSGKGTVTTKLDTSASDASYRVTLKSIKVGNVTLAYPKQSSPRGIVLDTASIGTQFPVTFFNQLKTELVKATNGTPREDPLGVYPLCYGVRDNIKLPSLTVQFSGAQLELQPSNTFVQISPDLTCLAIFPSDDGFEHLGYLFQTNFLIGFDMRKGQVSFKPTDCSKL